MIKAIVFDFCRVFLFPRDDHFYGQLNALHNVLSENPHYNFSDNFVFNKDLMDFVLRSGLRLKFDLYLLTSGNIHKNPECQKFLDGIFKEIFTTNDLKIRKSDRSIYQLLAKKIECAPADILFIDNNRENTEAAEASAFATITFRNNMQLETEINGYI